MPLVAAVWSFFPEGFGGVGEDRLELGIAVEGLEIGSHKDQLGIGTVKAHRSAQ